MWGHGAAQPYSEGKEIALIEAARSALGMAI
jgi:hypothetical protein